MDTGAFIIHHLAEVAKMTHENVIADEDTITAIAQALHYAKKFESLEPHFLEGASTSRP